jgi:hypothetical protein
MMLDILAHNNWERPIYYVTTTGTEAYIGLQDYFQQEGLAYRLVPVKYGRGEDRQPLGVNTSVMYDNLMNKFEFSVLAPGIYIDEDNHRMSSTYRNAFAQLAYALMEESKLDSAVQVSDRIMEMIPDRVVPLNYFNIAVGEVYFMAGQPEKGRAVFDRLLEIQEEQLDYYFSFPDHLRPAVQFQVEQCMAIIHTLSMSAARSGQEELGQEIQEELDFYYDLYLGTRFSP